MKTEHILAIIASAFLLLSIRRIILNGGRVDPASKTWLIITVIFFAVSAWLFLSI